MEPLTTATTFATIIGLLSNFMAEKRATSDDEYRAFLEWLSKKRHKELLDEINSNHLLGLSVKGLLSKNHNQVMDALNSLNESVSMIASRIGGLREIALAVSPNAELSAQALSILTQLDSSGGSVFLEIKAFGGTVFEIMDGDGGSIEFDEPRFIDDDLATLSELGLLRPDVNQQGYRLWRITREAAKLVKSGAGKS